MPATNRRPTADQQTAGQQAALAAAQEVLEVQALEAALHHPQPAKRDPVDVTVSVSIVRWRGRSIRVVVAPGDVAPGDD